MLINILSVLNGIKDSLMIDEMVSLDEFSDMMQEFQISQPVHVTGIVKNSFSRITLQLSVCAWMDTNCARCSKEIRIPLSFEVNSVVVKGNNADQDQNQEEETITIKGHQLNLAEIVWDNLLLYIDIIYLCQPDCKGLCPTCGQNLNIGNCGCDHGVVDDRLQVLKKLL